MNKIKSLLHVLYGKATVAAALLVIVLTAAVPSFAQTADVRYAGVFFQNNPMTTNELYCAYEGGIPKGRTSSDSNATFANAIHNNAVGDIVTDGDLKVKIISKGRISFVAQRLPNTLFGVGQKYMVVYINGSVFQSIVVEVVESSVERSFVFEPTPDSASHENDPWVSSALIEYDQPYPTSNTGDDRDNPEYRNNAYPNHCLALCMNVTCTNKPQSQSTYSISFPLQQVKFDIVKYYNNKNIENPEEAPAIRTIDLYPDQEAARCGSYHCAGAAAGHPCSSAGWVCSEDPCTKWKDDGTCDNWLPSTTLNTVCKGLRWGEDWGGQTGVYNCHADGSNCLVFNNDGTPTNQYIPFCAAWDGSYEIAGEFGKTNGQFGFRATVATDVPGDNIITDKISFNSTIAYPGMNQIPMQVDVTNIHTVRSTPSVVGNITSVAAQPYTYAYRLSKDADVRIAVFDASTEDEMQYGETSYDAHYDSCTTSIDTTITDEDACRTSGGIWGTFYADQAAYLNNNGVTGCCTGGGGQANILTRTIAEIGASDLVRMLVDWQPRLGEGMKGQEKDVQITEFDSWDGRDNRGMLLPAGNYIVSLQAKTQDEWSGIDFSRAVTRQMSLDPLKLTDVVATGLTKQSTAYASITYTPTESSKVYWYIYTPGTVFEGANTPAGILTNSSAPTGTAPAIVNNTGSLVAVLEEDRVGRMNFTSKWDGLCGIEGGCTRSYSLGEKMSNGQACSTTVPQYVSGNLCQEWFAQGAPMPDGNYIYALWAEIPYNGCYYNKASGWTDGTNKAPFFVAGEGCNMTEYTNTQAFTGVKTLKYTTGQIAIERGVVDITIQPVSYSTVGSSPTAYGLDPFIFKYSIARDATAIARVTNAAGITVKYLTPIEGITQVAQQMNTLSWDGRDDAGRMVTPGTYMFVVETKDAMFPAVTNRASAVFPVDMYRVVDLSTTDVYGDSDAKATISYSLSKAMNVQVNIYNKDVVIPNFQTSTGEYNSADVIATVSTTGYTGVLTGNTIDDSASTTYTIPGVTSLLMGTQIVYPSGHRVTITVDNNPNYVPGSAVWDEQEYFVTVVDETLSTSNAAWPPRVCNRETDAAVFCPAAATWDEATQTCSAALVNYVVPSRVNAQHACIYVNDESFTNYPATIAQAAITNSLDVRLQPIKTFERSAMKPGDGLTLTEEWEALYFNNPSKCVANSNDMTACPYEMVPDGQYPFFVSARSNEAFDRYYAKGGEGINGSTTETYLTGAPFKYVKDVVQEPYLYATDKVTGKINVTRGPVYFLDGSTVVYPNAPQLFNVSSGPVFVPPYEINFSVSRAATVEVAIVALQPNVCTPERASGVTWSTYNNAAGDVCKFLSTMTIVNTGNFDPNIVRKTYWDGTDNNGFYVKPGIYEVRLTAKNYPDPGLYQATVKKITVNADLLKVFDLLEADGYAISQRGTDMKISYQISVPMKVAIQIFKPGTTIYDYQKGTLRNPTTGTEVRDIREVLVKAITGIRPATTLIEEVWDGTDYAGQEVPDGTYPFRFVTALNGADIDSVTGEIVGDYASTDGSTNPALWKINRVADTYEYQNLHKATMAIGDGQFVCSDWEKTVFFYPNPFNDASKGTLEITKMPVPGEVSIKFFNLAGDLVRDSNYTCVDANNYQVTMGGSLSFNPDNTPNGAVQMTAADLAAFPSQRNAALRCRWDRTNQHGRKVARGVYFGLVDFKAKLGREHCQKVVKILIP